MNAKRAGGNRDERQRTDRQGREQKQLKEELAGIPELPVVGIGASAGGLAALKQLFGAMPDDVGVAFVIVVHLPPDHESHLATLLQPHCRMPVEQVTEIVPLEPNHVYVIPPNANISTIDTHLRLSPLEEPRRERAPIDHFFRTLSDTHDGNAVGVVLTGTGSDGTLGLRWIRERGGLAIVQAPEEAEYDGMPRSAIAAGSADAVLPLGEMAQRIVAFARTEPVLPLPHDGRDLPEDASRLVQKILAQVRVLTGHDLGPYKRSTILRRIRRRMQLQRIPDLGDYLDVLRADQREVRRLFDDLLITVTEFFRDEEVFARLERDVIPALFEGKGARDRLRVWSVGCSTGEEAYSLAILLQEEAARRDVRPQIQVFASDLHDSSLKLAREGIYPDSIAAHVAPERLERFFIKQDSSYRVRSEVRETVLFAPHDLLKDPPFSHLDLVVCRNVLIYLQRDVQQEVFSLFHYALDQGGFLLLGTSETVDRSDYFVCRDKRTSLYQRRDVPAREPHLPVFPLAVIRRGRDDSEPSFRESSRSHGALHERLVERLAPPSIVVTEEHEILHSSAHAGAFLRVPGGTPTNNVFKLVLDPLRVELRSALHEAKASGQPVRSKPLTVEVDGERRRVALRVRRSSEVETGGFFLVIFDEPENQAVVDTGESGQAVSVRELEAELELTKKRLQALIEEYETSQEEMQASNEELQSTNEELRSAMEELETSKEELQSMNEELTTLNQENRHKVDELSHLSSDLQNLLAATEIATLFLDRELRIARFTPRVTHLFNVRQTDRGRPLADITHQLGYSELHEDAGLVLDRLVPIEREVQSESGEWYMTRVLPYRGREDRIEGVVITFVDISARRHAEEALRQSEERYRTVVSQVGDYAIFSVAPDGGITTWNEGCERIFGYGSETFIGMDVAELFTREDRAAGIPDQERERAVREGRADNERWMLAREGRRFFASGVNTALRSPGGEVLGFAHVLRDETESRQIEEALRESEEQFRRAIEEAPIPIIMHAEDGEILQLSRSWTALTGYTAADAEVVRRWMTEAYGDGGDGIEDVVRRQFGERGGEPVRRELRITTRSGAMRHWSISASSPGALRDGRRFVVAMAEDVTERREHEQRLRQVMAELNHRVKNTLAVIDAVAQQTMARARSFEEFRRAFGERLRSIGAAHSLLTEGDWTGTKISDILRTELIGRVADEEQVSLAGPDILLRPKAALALHMAVHELATNAAKYGALRPPDGHVDVAWRLLDDESVELSWHEHGLPGIEPAEEGFGMRMIRAVVGYDLQGQCEWSFEEKGLRCRIAFPLSAVSADGGPVESHMVDGISGWTTTDVEERAPRVLVVEDSLPIAMALCDDLAAAGFEVVGPAPSLLRGTELAEGNRLDAALLDVDLGGEQVFPLARTLRERGVPFVLLTGFGREVLPDDFGDAEILGKPVETAALRTWLERSVDPGGIGS
jgi:two-component system CheB/CheR fusion protein